MTPQPTWKEGHVEEGKYVFLSWGAEITVTKLGWWMHRANTYHYTFSGAKGKYPDTLYRFTEFGDASIAEDRFLDIEISAKECYVGHHLGFDIDEIKEGRTA